jgi:hypothetical protein
MVRCDQQVPAVAVAVAFATAVEVTIDVYVMIWGVTAIETGEEAIGQDRCQRTVREFIVFLGGVFL